VELLQAVKGEFVSAVGSYGQDLGEFGDASVGLSLSPDETRLLVSDKENERVVVVDSRNGRSLHELRGPAGTLERPVQAIVVPQTGQVLVLDSYRSVVVVFTSADDDTVVRTLGDGEGHGPLQLYYPNSISVLDGDVPDAVASDGPVAVVADSGNHRLALWRVRDGTLVRHLGSEGDGPGQFDSPSAVTVVPARATGNAEAWLVVADDYRVQVMTRTGAVVRELRGDAGIKLGLWLGGVTVCVLTGEVLVTDTENHRLISWRIADGGGLRVVCGGVEGSDDGQFKHPVGLVVSCDGALWVADAGNHRLCCFAIA
jgi:DNA-binding beta-propeller fold protein YncE